MTDKATLLALAERVEGLDGPDREMDFYIARNTGWSNKCDARWGIASPHWWRNGKCITEMVWHYGPSGAYLPAFTASLDAAMTLVPEGCWLELKGPRRYLNIPTNSPNFWSAYLSSYNHEGDVMGWGATPALALCAAALRARAETQP